MHYDLIVIGAGPAGSSTAYWSSKHGLRVLLIEKHNLPRFKLCAGCLSKRVEGLLPDGWESLVLNKIRVGRLGYKGEEYAEAYSKEPVAYIVDRSSFDAFLANKAQEAGAELIDGCQFYHFEREGQGYRVFTSKGSFLCDFLVGADGFYSRVAKVLGYERKKFFRSLEFFTHDGIHEEVLIEIGMVKRGYLWVFPHGAGISVGVASTGKEDLLSLLKAYSDKKGIAYKHPKGWHIPFVEKEEELHLGKDRVLLVGDSAGMADPLLGEGIYYALWAGKLLSQALLENPKSPLNTYSELTKPLREELIYAGKIARLAYSFQKIAYRMGKSFAIKSFYELLSGRKSYANIYRKGLFKFLVEFLKLSF